MIYCLFNSHQNGTDIVSRYIIGIAAMYSRDLSYAESLFLEANNRLESKDSRFPAYQKLTQRIPIRIDEINELRAHASYISWTKTHEDKFIDELGLYLEKININMKSVLHLRSIYTFLKERDINEAIGFLNQLKKRNEGLYHYNMAFLKGYDGDLKSATRSYRQAVMYTITPSALSQIEDFICWILKIEPEKIQLYFCLGFFNWKAKGDLAQAIKDFRSFLEAKSSIEFPKERKLAARWIEDISKKKTSN